MATDLPYFRFTVQEWQNGNISLESYEIKGLFIDICGYYWLKDCKLTLALLKKKFSNDDGIDLLIKLKVLKLNKKKNHVRVNFLLTQYKKLSKKRIALQRAGHKGGLATASLKQNGSYKDKDKDKDKDKEKKSSSALRAPGLSFPYTSLAFTTKWEILRAQPKWKRKSREALQASLDLLKPYGEATAIKAMNNSIAGDWQGIFPQEVKEKGQAVTVTSKPKVVKEKRFLPRK